MAESGYKGEGDIRMMEQHQAKLEYEDVRKLMDKENPIIAQVSDMKIVDGLSADEIADTLGIAKHSGIHLCRRSRSKRL